MYVLIDNGHGAETPGKRSPDGLLREYAFAREIARGLVITLQANGVQASLLVPEETDVPLSERCRRANGYPPGNTALVSVHCNAAGDGSAWKTARGWEAWTSPGDTRADALASCLYAAAEETLPGTPIRRCLSDGDPDKEGRLYLLRHTLCPAVITENLFMDSREDAAFLLSASGKERVRRLHALGILGYLSSLP